MSKVTQEQADKYGISLAELEKLAEGKECSIYPGETLHVRRTKGGNITVFNISNKARGEQISKTKQEKAAAKKAAESAPAEESVSQGE